MTVWTVLGFVGVAMIVGSSAVVAFIIVGEILDALRRRRTRKRRRGGYVSPLGHHIPSERSKW